MDIGTQHRGEAGGRLESQELQAGGSEAGRLKVLINKIIAKRKQSLDTRFQQDRNLVSKND